MVFAKRYKKKLSKLSWVVVCLISIYSCFYFFNTRYTTVIKKTPLKNNDNTSVSLRPYNYRRTILLWTPADTSPFQYFGVGNKVFKQKKCKWDNCYIVLNRALMGDYTEFDVIAFAGPQLLPILTLGDLPVRRRIRQKYVYANIESSANYPLCSQVWNDFFNWTWTYKLNSDAVWGYMAIRNATRHVIGPNINMHWMQFTQMDDIDEDFKNKLKSKKKTAAWFVSNCLSQSLREHYVEKLRLHLRKFNMDIDIFGKCGQFGCPREIMSRCLAQLEKSYYFYLAFENAISEDYVTERIVYALKYNTVPIVFGGANYSRFMPDGAYLNANEMKPETLAAKMYEIIRNPSLYHSFFRWKKYYSFHFKNESPETDEYCNFCAMVNNDELMKRSTVYSRLDHWWTGPNAHSLCHPTTNT